MFEARQERGFVASAGSLLWLIYHNTVRSVRKSHGHALFALGTNIMQTVMMVGVFYVMFSLLGLRGMAIRGDGCAGYHDRRLCQDDSNRREM